MTDWTIFARDEYVADARDFDVLWDGATLLLEGSLPDEPGDFESLDAVFDARFAHLDEAASQLAEEAGRDRPALFGDALALRYELVKLLRLAAFFSVVRPLARDAILTFFYDPRRDADYAALLQSLADATESTVRLAPIAPFKKPDPAPASSNARGPIRRLDVGGQKPTPKSPAWRGANGSPALWRAWAARANAAFDAGWNALRRDRRAPVALLGRPEILNEVCGELLARGERVVWLWEHFHAGVFARWRAAGVQLVTLDGYRGQAREAAPPTSAAPLRLHSDPMLAELAELKLTHPGPHAQPIDLALAVRAWATTRRDAWMRRARWERRLDEVFATRPPKSLIVDEDATPLKRTAIAAARRLHVESVVVQHGAPGVRFGFAPVAADVHLAWGETSQRKLLAWGVSSQKIAVVGCPRRDRWPASQPGERASLRVRSSLSPCQTVLVLASPAPRDDRPDSLAFPLTTVAHREMWANVFRALAGRSLLRAIVKLHPRDPNIALLAKLASDRQASVEWRMEGDAADCFAEADAVISLASSAGLEAAAWGLPVVSVVPSRAAELYGARDWGLVAEVRSQAGLEAALDVALDRGRLDNDVHREQLARTFDGLDGQAARRAVDMILSRAAARRPAIAA